MIDPLEGSHADDHSEQRMAMQGSRPGECLDHQTLGESIMQGDMARILLVMALGIVPSLAPLRQAH
jgi:hypothetical protein